MGVGWEEDKRCVTYGLEPFVFDPGPQTSQEELARDAEKRVRSDKRFREVLSKEKAAITAVLQGCLEKVNGQLERGEEVCQKAHFPLLNPRDFEDMESFARHDHFTVDLRIDKVDESLQKLVSSLLGIVWTNIQVENETKAKSLERFSQALQERMETLEYHLNDRSRQLSNCRYAYFLEITHLRNQLYIKNQSDDENFEPVEAYFFDPTEYLEEELRQQLNDKITLSVKVYKEKLNAKCREVADLELQLETLQALNAQRNDDNLENYLQIACNKHGAKNVVETLAQLAEKEMHQWAQNVRGGKTPQANAEGLEGSFSPARLEQMRQAMMQAAQEAEEERALRRQAEEALREAQKELEELTRALEEQKLNDAGSNCSLRRSAAKVQSYNCCRLALQTCRLQFIFERHGFSLLV
ncbi:unnamed protein product [Durusdinium trenchii]|uniref:Uncharacterized protein n=1 Tax=Durusdinium trenchii TaxID=1381693 RepID=A0ABP0LU50_9DINO